MDDLLRAVAIRIMNECYLALRSGSSCRTPDMQAWQRITERVGNHLEALIEDVKAERAFWGLPSGDCAALDKAAEPKDTPK